MSFRCPKCRRPLANRRRKTCEFCAAVLPDHLVMTKDQVAKIDRLKADERKRYRLSNSPPDWPEDSESHISIDVG